MFASLKNKIKEETGAEVSTISTRLVNSNRSRGRLSSSASITSFDDGHLLEQKDTEIATLRNQVADLVLKLDDLNKKFDQIQEEKSRIEKTNEILLEAVRVSQNQKELYCDEQEKIQNFQSAEIEKLKSLLSFREQEAVDRLATIKQTQQQIQNLTGELERIKVIEPLTEDLRDELERLRHSSQIEKNLLTSTLAAVEEDNRHLKRRLEIVDQSRLESILTLSNDEKVQALVQERKLLEQHLEEAHLQLSDIKSSWSGQNLALETQVSRLSRQVAEETTDKRKVLKSRDEHVEKVKQLEFDIEKMKDEVQQRNSKIKLLEEEIDELNIALKECRENNVEEVICLKNNLEAAVQENKDLKSRLQDAEERFNDYAEKSENVSKVLRNQNVKLLEQLADVTNSLEIEKQEKLTALLRNAEISQCEEILKKEIRIERDESNDMQEKIVELQSQLKTKTLDHSEIKFQLDELKAVIYKQKEGVAQVDTLHNELNEKNKIIKVLNQRLTDLKKTIQKEMMGNQSFECNDKSIDLKSNNNGNSLQFLSSTTSSGKTVVMDEVNFKYLKHVIVKFLTSREVEARHLIRAVATLLQLNSEEEKLIHDTLNWKMSWFGSKPNQGSGQRSFSIPPS